jgi:hypothetical protein
MSKIKHGEREKAHAPRSKDVYAQAAHARSAR